MGVPRISGRITYRGSPDATRRELSRVLPQELDTTGREWHGEMLPGHFLMSAYGKYGYAPRSTRRPPRGDRPGRERLSYVAAKQKYKHHNLPLVWSGDLRTAVMRQQDVRSKGRTVRVVLHGPRYLYQYRKDLRQPDKAAELTIIVQDEAMELARRLDRRVTKRLQECRTAEVREMKGA